MKNPRIIKLKTIIYRDDQDDPETEHTITRCGGDLVRLTDGKELPFAGDEYFDGVIADLIKNDVPYAINYVDHECWFPENPETD